MKKIVVGITEVPVGNLLDDSHVLIKPLLLTVCSKAASLYNIDFLEIMLMEQKFKSE